MWRRRMCAWEKKRDEWGMKKKKKKKKKVDVTRESRVAEDVHNEWATFGMSEQVEV